MLLFDVLTLSLCYCLNISYRESRALAVSVLLDLFVSDLHMFVVAVVKPQLLVSLTADGNYTTRRADSESAQSICRLDSVPQIHSSVCMLRSVRVVTVVTELSFKDPPPFLWVNSFEPILETGRENQSFLHRVTCSFASNSHFINLHYF